MGYQRDLTKAVIAAEELMKMQPSPMEKRERRNKTTEWSEFYGRWAQEEKEDMLNCWLRKEKDAELKFFQHLKPIQSKLSSKPKEDKANMKHIWKFDYDRDADVLYAFIDVPRPAKSIEEGDVVLRIDPTGKLVGVTIVDFIKRFEELLEGGR